MRALLPLPPPRPPPPLLLLLLALAGECMCSLVTLVARHERSSGTTRLRGEIMADDVATLKEEAEVDAQCSL